MRSIEDWIRILMRCGVAQRVASIWAPVFRDTIKPDTFSAGDRELDDFLGQILHESMMLTRLEEGLSYSRAERICQVWPKRFPTVADAAPFVRNPQGLANRVYGGRLGNREPNDGWMFRGRGLIQVTGRENYTRLAEAMRINLIADPDRLAEQHIALRASIAWWEGSVPDSVMGDIVKVTKRVNGGTHGLDDRRRLTNKAEGAL